MLHSHTYEYNIYKPGLRCNNRYIVLSRDKVRRWGTETEGDVDIGEKEEIYLCEVKYGRNEGRRTKRGRKEVGGRK